VKSLVARRRHPLALALLLLFALAAVAGIYAVASASAPAIASDSTQTQVEEGKKLYLEGCSSCHGLGAEGTVNGPTLIGVGAAAVDFQVSSGRMPLAAPGAQAQAGPAMYDEKEIAQLAAYVASLAPGPQIPTAEDLNTDNVDVALGGLLFRTNCAQCHQAAGGGGALTQGKYAPSLMGSEPKEIWEAMVTGPQSMPVFSDSSITPDDKRAIIAYIEELQTASSPGGLDLGRIGPVTETVFLFTAVAAALAFAAIWIGMKAR
jgi:ubiquinol-cytochrome c reductase cytochrome c subunit